MTQIKYLQFKSCAKKLAKRFSITYSNSLNLLARACGFSNLYELQRITSTTDGAPPHVPVRPTSLDEWSSGLKSAFGNDIESLFNVSDQQTWFRRIFSTHTETAHAFKSATAEAADTHQ